MKLPESYDIKTLRELVHKRGYDKILCFSGENRWRIKTMSKLLQSITENVVFVTEFLGIVAAVILVTYLIEKGIQKAHHEEGRILDTRKVVMIGMFAAIAGVLMLFEFGLPFIPFFYKLDFSEIPVLICGFAFGPVAGVLTEFVKILVKLVLKGTSTAFVGELANFAVGCTFIIPATVIYQIKKKKSFALAGCMTGTIIMSVFGTIFNAVYLLPVFAVLFHMPMDELIAIGTSVNASITDITTFVCFAVAPLNLIKGASVSAVTILVYKHLSPILKTAHIQKKTNSSTIVEN